MSNYEWNDENDTDDDDQSVSDGNGMKDLRKAFNSLKKQHKELQDNYGKVAKSSRDRNVKDVLAGLGMPEKISAFIPDDVTSSEGVTEWVNEYGDLFGAVQPKQEVAETTPNVDLSALNRISQTQAGGQTHSADAGQIDAQIAGAQSMEELNMVLFGHKDGPPAS